MAPIEKNVRVFDEQGNEYEATYPKRAKGLVKNGRARFVGENTICLACPPDKIMEEKTMENTNKNIANEVVNGKPTMAYILEQLEMLKENDGFLDKALEKLANVKSEGPEISAHKRRKGAEGCHCGSRNHKTAADSALRENV